MSALPTSEASLSSDFRWRRPERGQNSPEAMELPVPALWPRIHAPPSPPPTMLCAWELLATSFPGSANTVSRLGSWGRGGLVAGLACRPHAGGLGRHKRHIVGVVMLKGVSPTSQGVMVF